MKQLLFIGLLFGFISYAQNDELDAESKNEIQTIMAILAHPDDESAIGQILAKYASEGKNVVLVIATDGRYGVEEHAGIPPGDTLAMIRMKESICACEILGIEKPIFLDAHDVFGAMNGMGEYFKQTAEVKQKLTRTITEINPDAIITFGPDGDTGHMDHKGISDLVTEVLLMNKGFYEKYPLYYLAWPKEKEVSIPQGSLTNLNYVDKSYRNIHIKYTEEDRNKALKSLECYKSQLTNEDIEKWIEAELKDTTFTTYFRQFVTDTEVKDHF
jgi:LmbE family N-acetylglucosaminyl deacetylase